MNFMFRLIDRQEGRAERQAAAARSYAKSLAAAREPIQIIRLEHSKACYIVAYDFHQRVSESASLAYLPKIECDQLIAAGAKIWNVNDLPRTTE